jgi:hypothetical protein
MDTDLPVLKPVYCLLLGALGSGSFSTSLKALAEEFSEMLLTKEPHDLAALWLMASHSAYRRSSY